MQGNTILCVCVLCTVSFVLGQEDWTGSYLRYDNYSSADFDSVPGQYTPTEQDCVALATVAPMTNGVVYNTLTCTCKIMTNTNNDILIRLRANSGSRTYVKDISDKWSILFKGENQINNGFSTNYRFGQSYLGNADFTTNYTSAVLLYNSTNPCKCNYRNPYIDYWSNVYLVQLQAFRNGLPVATFTFNLYNTGYMSTTGRYLWFNWNYLVAAAPYKVGTLKTTGDNYGYSIPGESPAACGYNNYRDFQMGRSSGYTTYAYSSSTYYLYPHYLLVCNDYPYSGCTYGNGYTPSIYYSLTNAACLPQTICSGVADYLVVSAKIRSRAIFV